MRPIVSAGLFGSCAAALIAGFAIDKPEGQSAAMQEGSASVLPIATANQATRPQTIQDVQMRVGSLVPGFGGFFVDPGEPDRLKVWLTDPVAQLEPVKAALAEMVGNYPGFKPQNVDALLGKYGFVQLQAWHDRLFAEVVKQQSLGVVMMDVQEKTNRIQIGVQTETAEATLRQALIDLNIPEEAVVVVKRGPILPLSCDFTNSLQSCRRPLYGGIQIDDGGGSCTLGFMARRGGVQGMVTASHCSPTKFAPDGGQFGQPDTVNTIGVEEVDPTPFPGVGGVCPSGARCRWSDAAWINLGSTQASQGWIAYPAVLGTQTWNGSDAIAIINAEIYDVGAEVWKVGAQTGRKYGHVTQTWTDELTEDQQGNPVWLLGQFRASPNLGGVGGDSGSPVFVDHGAANATLVGLLWARDSYTDELVYSDAQVMQWELGALDVTAPPSGGGGGK